MTSASEDAALVEALCLLEPIVSFGGVQTGPQDALTLGRGRA